MPDQARQYGTLWQRIRRMVGGEEETPATVPPETEAQPSAPDPDDRTMMVRRLRGLMRDQRAVTAGALQIIDLGRIRSALQVKSRWQHLETRIQAIVPNVIRLHLDSFDVFLEMEGPSYLIVFGRLTPEAAAAKCSVIAREVERRLLGESSELRGGKVGTAVARLTANGVELVESSSTDETLRHLFAQAAGTGAASVQGSPISGGSDGGEARSVEPGWEKSAPLGRGSPWIVETHTPHAAEGGATDWYYETDVLRAPEIGCAYLPMWHVHQHAVGTFHCVPSLPISRSHVLLGEAVFHAAPPSLICDINLKLLDIAAAEIAALRKRGGEALIGLPVHFETIASRTHRSRYLAACAALDAEVRNHLLIELIDLPEGSPEGRLCELVNWLRPWGRALCIRTSLDCRRFEPFAAAHILAIGTSLGGHEEPEVDLMEQMNGFTSQATRLGLKTYALELRSRSLTVAALGAGFDFISGAMVSSVVDAPASAYRFDAIDLYTDPSPAAV